MFKKLFLVLLMSLPLSAYADTTTHGSFNFHGGSLPINSETTITVDGVSYSIGSLITDINQAMSTLSGIDAQIAQIETTSNTAYNVAATASSNAQNSMNIASAAIPKSWIDVVTTSNITGVPSLNSSGYIHSPIDAGTIVHGSNVSLDGKTMSNVLQAIEDNASSISTIQGNISGSNATVVLKTQIGENNGVAGLNSTGSYIGSLENNTRTGGSDTGTDISAANLSSSMTGEQAVAAILSLQNAQTNQVTTSDLNDALTNYLPTTGGDITNGLNVHGSLNAYTNITVMNGYNQTFWPTKTGVLGVNVSASSYTYGLLQITDTAGGSGGISTGAGVFSGSLSAKTITGDISAANLSSSMTGEQAVAAISANATASAAAQTTANTAVTNAATAQSAAQAAQATASAAIPLTQKGAASGVASLDSSGNVTAPVWSPQITSAPLSTSTQQPLINAGRFPVVSALAQAADPFQSPDAFYIGGLPTQGWSSDGKASNNTSRPGSLVITGQPWGPFNSGALESILMTNGVDAQNGVCAEDWRAGAGYICGADGVGQYIGVTNVEALTVSDVGSFTATSVVLSTPLTTEQISQLRVGMYISTNIINDTVAPTAATDSWGNAKLEHHNYYQSVISGWSSDGSTIYVPAWDIPSASTHAAGQIPQQITGDAVDTWGSNYGVPVVFIGNPDDGSAHNEYLDYKGYNAGDVSGVFPLNADIVEGSSTITIKGTPSTVSGYTTNITGNGIASGTTVTDLSTSDGVTTVTLSTPTTSAVTASKNSVTIFSSGITKGTALAHGLTGDEIDLRYFATREHEVHLDGLTISVAGDVGNPIGRTGLTPDSYMLSLSGDVHNLLILDGPTDGNAISGHSIYVGGGFGTSTTTPLYEMSDIGAFPDAQGNQQMRVSTYMTKETSTVGPGGTAVHVGLVNGGKPGDGLPDTVSGWGQIVFNRQGAVNGGVSLCGGVGGLTGSSASCGVNVDYNGNTTTNSLTVNGQMNMNSSLGLSGGNRITLGPSSSSSTWVGLSASNSTTMELVTSAGGDASLAGVYNFTSSGAASFTGTASFSGSATFNGQINANSSVGITSGNRITLAPTGNSGWSGITADSSTSIKLQTSAGGDASLSGIYNLTSSGAATFSGSLIIPFGTPASSTATCTQGQTEMDATYTYSCVAANTWHRVENGATW